MKVLFFFVQNAIIYPTKVYGKKFTVAVDFKSLQGVNIVLYRKVIFFHSPLSHPLTRNIA